MHTALPAAARLWVFTAAHPLSEDAARALLDRVEDFLGRWSSHGRSVSGKATVWHDRFLIVAAHLEGGISGCGIDSLTHEVERIGEDVGVEWVDGLHLAFRDANGAVQVVPRPVFRRLVRDGVVTAATPVFVTTLETLGELRAAGLERPASEAWHGRVFRIPGSGRRSRPTSP